MTIFLIMGGVKSCLLRFLFTVHNALIIVIDNQREISALRRLHPHQHFHSFAMGRGTTSLSAHRGHANAASGRTASIANSGFHDGFGGLLLNAKLAADALVASADFQSFASSLPDEVLIRTGGAPELIQLEAFGSLAGSACAGGVKTVTTALLPHLLPFRIEVNVKFHMLGATTFAGQSTRARPNSASASLSLLELVTDSSDPLSDSVTKQLCFHEHRPFQEDVIERSKALLQECAAMSSIQMRDYRALTDVNHLNDGPFGGVISSQVDFKKGLDREHEIASQVAKSLLEDLQDHLVDVPSDPLLIDDLRWQDDSVPQARPEFEEVLQHVETTDAKGIVRALTSSPSRYRFRIMIDTKTGSQFEVERLSEDFSVVPTDLELYRLRLQLLETFHLRLKEEFGWIEGQLATLRESTDELKAEVEKQHARVLKSGYFSSGRRWKDFVAAATKLRTTHDELVLRQAESDAISRALAATIHERDHHQNTVKDIQTVLKTFVPRGSLSTIPSFVSVSTLSGVFGQLLNLPGLPKWEQVDRLCSAAGTVNANGLARIVGSESDRLDRIADAIVHGTYAVTGPPHGARQPQHRGEVIYALPPMEPQLEGDLEWVFQQAHPGAKVVFGDSVTFGANVLRIFLHRFSGVQEVFDGLTGYDLKKAMTGQDAVLNSDDGFSGVPHFRGKIVGDRVVFGADEQSDDSDGTAGSTPTHN